VSASEFEVSARRARAAAAEMLGSVGEAWRAEQVAESFYDLHETLVILTRLLEVLGQWYEAHAEDLYPLIGPPDRADPGAPLVCAHELRQTAAEMSAVVKRMGVVVEAVEKVGSRTALRVTAHEAAHLATAGRAVFVVRHVSFAAAMSWDVGFATDEAVARWDAAELAAALPAGDVAQATKFKPKPELPEPALHTYPGTAEPRSLAP
jgi:hypothetical protein